jgi:hypothetical protein
MSTVEIVQSRELGIEILKKLESHFGVDLTSIVENPALKDRGGLRALREALRNAILRYDGYPEEEAGHDRFVQSIKEDPKVELEPNLFYSRKNANYIADLKGNDVYDYVTGLAKRLEALAQSESVAQFVATTIGGGILSVSVPVGWQVAKGLVAKEALKTAIKNAIVRVGLKSAVFAVAVALIGIVYWLIWEKEAKILGVIVNDTDSDLIVYDFMKSVDGYNGGNLYMAHGTTESFMADNVNGDLDSPLVQLKSRFADVTDEDTMVAFGIFYADRKAGFLGAEGLYVFAPFENPEPPGFAYQFAVPYSKSNGANIQLFSTNGPINNEELMNHLFREMYDTMEVDIDKQQGNYRLRSHVQSASGGVICAVASISEPLPTV